MSNGLYERNGGIQCFRYKDADGVWREKSTGTKAKKKARQFKKKWERMIEEGSLPTDKADWTVAQACTAWVTTHAARLNSQRARTNEQCNLRQLLRILGAKKLKQITLDDLKRYQLKRSATVRERPINIELGILVSTLKEENLWRGSLLKYKRLTEPESEVGEALSIGELQRLQAAASSNPAWEVAYCAQVLAANSGMRGGEIRKLRLGAIDLEKCRLRIVRASTKTSAGARWVELNRAATQAVARLYQRAELLGASSPDHYLLPADLSRHTKASDPLTGQKGIDPTRHQEAWTAAWRSIRKAAGLPKLRFHSLRHTFVTMMAENGTPLQVTQALVGHISPAITRHYTHISQQAARAAVEKLNNLGPLVDVFVDESLNKQKSQAGTADESLSQDILVQ
jgi:integrase